MKTIFIIACVFTGLSACFWYIVLTTKSDASQTIAEATPKSNDQRIVRYSDGTYSIQYYWEYPGWRDLNTRDKFATMEEAKRILDAMNKPRVPTVVSEVIKYER